MESGGGATVKLTRRGLMQGAAAATLAAGIRPAQAKELVVGFIYVGPKDDYGYNQAHAEGAAALKGMPGLKLIEEARWHVACLVTPQNVNRAGVGRWRAAGELA